MALTFWPDAASPPSPGIMGTHTTFASAVVLTPSQSTSGSAVFGSSVTNGTGYASVDYSNVVLETDDNNNVSAGFCW